MFNVYQWEAASKRSVTYLNLHPRCRGGGRLDKTLNEVPGCSSLQSRGRREGGVTLVGYNSIFTSIQLSHHVYVTAVLFIIYLLQCKDSLNKSFNRQHCFNPEVVPFPGISQAKDGWYLGSWRWELGDAPAIPRCASRPAQHSQAVHGRVQHLPTINLWRVCSSDQEYPCLSLILPLDQCHNGGESLPRWISKFNLFRNLISIWQPVMFHLH